MIEELAVTGIVAVTAGVVVTGVMGRETLDNIVVFLSISIAACIDRSVGIDTASIDTSSNTASVPSITRPTFDIKEVVIREGTASVGESISGARPFDWKF